ncbi:hypothetical protein P692DRAFT_20288899 [Suillus brevipes Sb2]|nr:hypothetical protein P692DRAFT_20288899 [Suillus brevipes Sb2]
MEQRSSSVMAAPASSKHVEIIVDIDRREGGWILKCDKGGIRRVLMNLFGNSLKFTTDGYVHVSLRQVSAPNEEPCMVELCVSDTGKGISQNFLKNHLFHPFSQENPLQAGTGLGLAIVNSIVQSPSVGGKVEVSSEESVGTDIKITFQAETLEDGASALQTPFIFDGVAPTVTFLGFKQKSKGVQMLSDYLLARPRVVLICPLRFGRGRLPTSKIFFSLIPLMGCYLYGVSCLSSVLAIRGHFHIR